MESGGILGGKNGIISEFIFDAGLENSNIGAYYPDTAFLNQRLSDWQNHGIHFYGIFHSHFQDDKELSMGDKNYINSIMQGMPSEVNSLYFPLVLPPDKMVSFIAKRLKGMVTIVCDNITII